MKNMKDILMIIHVWLIITIIFKFLLMKYVKIVQKMYILILITLIFKINYNKIKIKINMMTMKQFKI